MLPRQDSPTHYDLGHSNDSVKELLERQRLLLQMVIEANSSATLEEALATVVSRLRDAGICDQISILLPDGTGHLQVKTSTGYEISQGFEQSFAPGEGITGQAAAQKQPVRVDDVLAVPNYISLDPEVRSELAVPILSRDEVIGVLNLESNQPNDFDESDEAILAVMCLNLGSIISNFKLMSQVRQHALHDRLLNEAASNIRRSVNLETVLQTSAKEIAQVLGVRKVKIRIDTRSVDPNENASPKIPERSEGSTNQDKPDSPTAQGGE